MLSIKHNLDPKKFQKHLEKMTFSQHKKNVTKIIKQFSSEIRASGGRYEVKGNTLKNFKIAFYDIPSDLQEKINKKLGAK